MDDIYSLSAIISHKLSEKNKVYIFFVAIKAAFDSVARTSLMYKLYGMGVSYKFVKFLEAVYSTRQSAV